MPNADVTSISIRSVSKHFCAIVRPVLPVLGFSVALSTFRALTRTGIFHRFHDHQFVTLIPLESLATRKLNYSSVQSQTITYIKRRRRRVPRP